MKRYIQSKTTMKSGSFVVDRDGKIYDIGMHVPSTTYLGRGLLHLATTDAEFLLNQGLISEDEALAIILYCYEEFLEDEKNISDFSQVISLNQERDFVNYAEMKWAPTARGIFFDHQYRTLDDVEDAMSELPDFGMLNKKWYNYLKDNYVKVSRFGNIVEFRISSDDGYDWNKVIIDKVILKFDSGKPYTTRYNIIRETENGYKSYFYNATLEDILQNDKAVLSSELLDRTVVDGEVKYTKRFVGAAHKVDDSVTLEEWCKYSLPSDIKTLYLHWIDGTIIGKAPIKDAIHFYGDATVSNSYSDGDGQVSVWVY